MRGSVDEAAGFVPGWAEPVISPNTKGFLQLRRGSPAFLMSCGAAGYFPVDLVFVWRKMDRGRTPVSSLRGERVGAAADPRGSGVVTRGALNASRVCSAESVRTVVGVFLTVALLCEQPGPVAVRGSTVTG